MITGDYRSAVHAAAAEPWRIDVVVHEMLTATEECGRIMQQYASEALRDVPIGAGDVLTLGEMVEWCWGVRGVHDRSLPGLAWAVVMRPRNPPRGNDLGVTFVSPRIRHEWTCRDDEVLREERSTLIRLSSGGALAWMGAGEYGVDVGLYYGSNRCERGEVTS